MASKQQSKKDRILGALTRLNDKNTQPGAIHDIAKLVEELDEDGLALFVGALSTPTPDQKPHARKESVKVISLLTSTRNPVSLLALEAQNLNKLLNCVKFRLKDTDATVRDAAADTLASMAESLDKPQHKALKTPANINLMLKAVFECLGEQRKESQLGGCTAALKLAPHLPPLPAPFIKSVLKLLSNSSFHVKPQLVMAVAHASGSGFEVEGLMRNGAEVWAPALSLLVGTATTSGLLAMLAGQDWHGRRAAADALKCILYVYGPFLDTAHKVVGDGQEGGKTVSAELLNKMYAGLDKCRYDKIKPVRDIVIEALDVHALLQAFVHLGLPHERWHAWCQEEAALQHDRKANGESDTRHRRSGSFGGGHVRSNSGGRSRVAATAGAPAGAAKPPMVSKIMLPTGKAGPQVAAQQPGSPTAGTSARLSRVASPVASRGSSRAASPHRRSLSGGLPSPTASTAAAAAGSATGPGSRTVVRASSAMATSPTSLAALRAAHRRGGSGQGSDGAVRAAPNLAPMQTTPATPEAAEATLTSAGEASAAVDTTPTAEGTPTGGMVGGDDSPLSFTISVNDNTLVSAGGSPGLSAAAAARTSRLGGARADTAAAKEVARRLDGLEMTNREVLAALRRIEQMASAGFAELGRRLDTLQAAVDSLQQGQSQLAEGQAGLQDNQQRLLNGQASLANGQASLAMVAATTHQHAAVATAATGQATPSARQVGSPSRVASAVAALTAAAAASGSPRTAGVEPGHRPLVGRSSSFSCTPTRGALDLPSLRTSPHTPRALGPTPSMMGTTHGSPALTPACAPAVLAMAAGVRGSGGAAASADASMGGVSAGSSPPLHSGLHLHTPAAGLSNRDLVAPASPTAAPHVNPLPLPMPPYSVSGGSAAATPLSPALLPALASSTEWTPSKSTAPSAEDIDKYYREALSRGDSFYILRLMRKTGPCWDTLHPPTAAILLRVQLALLAERSAVQRVSPWLEAIPTASAETRRAMHDAGLDVQLRSALGSPLREQVGAAFTPDALWSEQPAAPPPAPASPPMAASGHDAPAVPSTPGDHGLGAQGSPTSPAAAPSPAAPPAAGPGSSGSGGVESRPTSPGGATPGTPTPGSARPADAAPGTPTPGSTRSSSLLGGANASSTLAAMQDQLNGLAADLARLPNRSPRV